MNQIKLETKKGIENTVKLDLVDDDYSNQTACESCVSEGGGCCSGTGSGIFVTLHDILRIKKKSGLSLDEIAIFKKVDNQEWLEDLKGNDAFFYEAVRGNKLLQLIRKDGYCQFLVDKKGCSIFNSRPAVCRMFPFSFDFTKDGKIRLLVPKAARRKDEDCTILEENYYRSKGANLKAMNTTKERMMELIKKHIYELQMYKLYVEDLQAGMKLDEIVDKWKIKLSENEDNPQNNLATKNLIKKANVSI